MHQQVQVVVPCQSAAEKQQMDGVAMVYGQMGDAVEVHSIATGPPNSPRPTSVSEYATYYHGPVGQTPFAPPARSTGKSKGCWLPFLVRAKLLALILAAISVTITCIYAVITMAMAKPILANVQQASNSMPDTMDTIHAAVHNTTSDVSRVTEKVARWILNALQGPPAANQ
jgi:hypothetical protein